MFRALTARCAHISRPGLRKQRSFCNRKTPKPDPPPRRIRRTGRKQRRCLRVPPILTKPSFRTSEGPPRHAELGPDRLGDLRVRRRCRARIWRGSHSSSQPKEIAVSQYPSEVIAAAQAAEKAFYPLGPFVSVSLAQWALESAYGHAEPAGSNNPFGIRSEERRVGKECRP